MCPNPDVPLMGENIHCMIKRFKYSFSKKVHISESYIVKFLLNIWNHGKNLHDLSGQNPCKKWWTGVTFGHYHDFHGLKLSYLFFTSKIVI